MVLHTHLPNNLISHLTIINQLFLLLTKRIDICLFLSLMLTDENVDENCSSSILPVKLASLQSRGYMAPSEHLSSSSFLFIYAAKDEGRLQKLF